MAVTPPFICVSLDVTLYAGTCIQFLAGVTELTIVHWLICVYICVEAARVGCSVLPPLLSIHEACPWHVPIQQTRYQPVVPFLSLPFLSSFLPLLLRPVPEGKLKGYSAPTSHLSCPFKWSLSGFALAEEIFSGAWGWGRGSWWEKGLKRLILLPPLPLPLPSQGHPAPASPL